MYVPQILFVDRSLEMVKALQYYFKDVPSVSVKHCNDIREYLPNSKVVVSPCNSFGELSGGIDAAYASFYGPKLEDYLRYHLSAQYHGELPVGQACMIPHEGIYFICAPTMRVPMNVARTHNAYLAFRAAVALCHEQCIQDTIICPGFCIGVGRMKPNIAAKQMRMAWDAITTQPELPMNLGAACKHEMQMHYDD
jgi:O-acetyl-ADP-ribose deacetylase (regulator of RNase III)